MVGAPESRAARGGTTGVKGVVGLDPCSKGCQQCEIHGAGDAFESEGGRDGGARTHPRTLADEHDVRLRAGELLQHLAVDSNLLLVHGICI